MWYLSCTWERECKLDGGMLVDSGSDVDLGVGDQGNGKWVSKDSVEPGSIVPVPLVGGEVRVFAEGWLDEGVVRVVVELDDVSPVVVGKVGDFGEVLRVVVEVTEYDDGVFGE